MKAILLLAASVAMLHGCATPSQMSADAEVRRLCAIDGGIKVYETVTLPAERFNQWGQVDQFRPSQKENALGPDYIFNWDMNWLDTDGSAHSLKILREHFKVTRTIDRKLLGETVLYGRGGGDIPGPWHPSTFSCPLPSEAGVEALLKQIFVKSAQ